MRRSVPVRAVSPTRIEVDLRAVVANARDVQQLVGSSSGVFAMLKADAYGHGLVPVARALANDGTVAGLVITSVQDGLALRQEGVAAPLLVLTSSYAGTHGAVLGAGMIPIVTSMADLEAFGRAARSLGIRAQVHVKIDTGMSRLGVREEDLGDLLVAAAEHPELVVSGLCTHLATADAERVDAAHAQLDAFERAYSYFVAAGHRPTVLHASNTAGAYRLPRSRFTHVRTGIALFGGDEPSGARLRPALRFVTAIAQLRTIAAGEFVSYGRAWRAARPSRIATLPVGYAHGYPRRLLGRGEVLVRGRRCPVVGAICMEMILVDVTDLGPHVDVGEEVVLLGDDGGDEIRATDLARAVDGIVEEIFCGLSKSVPREHFGALAARHTSEGVRDVSRDRTSSRPS